MLTAKTSDLLVMVNMIIAAAVYNGGDYGGPYNIDLNGLRTNMEHLLDALGVEPTEVAIEFRTVESWNTRCLQYVPANLESKGGLARCD